MDKNPLSFEKILKEETEKHNIVVDRSMTAFNIKPNELDVIIFNNDMVPYHSASQLYSIFIKNNPFIEIVHLKIFENKEEIILTYLSKNNHIDRSMLSKNNHIDRSMLS